MVKYVLCIVTILLLVVDAFIYFDLKKYIKVHENELVENHIKGLLGRTIAMTVISVCVGVEILEKCRKSIMVQGIGYGKLQDM